jgi:hypothetical protein
LATPRGTGCRTVANVACSHTCPSTATVTAVDAGLLPEVGAAEGCQRNPREHQELSEAGRPRWRDVDVRPDGNGEGDVAVPHELPQRAPLHASMLKTLTFAGQAPSRRDGGARACACGGRLAPPGSGGYGPVVDAYRQREVRLW